MDQSLEQWRPVEGLAGLYEVSDRGRVRSLDRIVFRNNKHPIRLKGKLLSCPPDAAGYPVAQLGRRRRAHVHVLVATAFIGPCPGKHGTGRHDYNVDHINNNRADNRACNLRWATHYENCHAKPLRQGRRNTARGERCARAKLTEADVRLVLADQRNGVELARELNVNKGTIYGIRSGKTWKHVSAS